MSPNAKELEDLLLNAIAEECSIEPPIDPKSTFEQLGLANELFLQVLYTALRKTDIVYPASRLVSWVSEKLKTSPTIDAITSFTVTQLANALAA